MFKKQDLATTVLGAVCVLLLFVNQYMFTLESRNAVKVGIHAREALGANYLLLLAITAVLFILILIKGEHELLNFVTGLVASLGFGLAILSAGQAANVVELPSGGRISPSIGCYLYLVLVYVIEVKCNEYLPKVWQRFLTIGIGFGIAIFAFFSGQLDGLSVMKEYLSKQYKFSNLFHAHITMVVKVVLWGILLGVPIGWISFKFKRLGRVVSIILSGIQSIPTMAFLGLLLFPLAFLNTHFAWAKALGITGFGETPVFLALLLYALFQIVNSVYGALNVIDQQYIENAAGLGMTTLQIFTKIELPLILPVIVSGIRVAIIAAISLAAIGAYAGYGDLGSFIIYGTRGFAIDMILVGTIPIMIMIFFFDFVFRKLALLIDYVRVRKGRVNI